MLLPEEAGAAWDSIAKGIIGAEEPLGVLRARFIGMIIAGNVSKVLERQAEMLLAPVDWTWPWFEEWVLKFTDRGEWPVMWPELEPEAEIAEEDELSAVDLAIFRRRAIAPLIIHTAMMQAHSAQTMSSKSTTLFDLRLVAGLGDAAEARVAAEHAPRIAAGDYSSLPPYFPGDRTTVTGERRRP